MYGVVLRLLGFDPNTSDPAQVAQAEQFLASHSANMSVIAPDDGQDRLFKHEVDMVVEYSGDIFQIMSDCKCDDFAYLIPQEGGRVWVDNLAIPAVAQNKALAQIFIDYILDAQVGADISNFTAYASPNHAAIKQGLIAEDYLTNTVIYPDAETMTRLFYIKSDPTLAPIYDQSWEQLKTTLGPKGIIPS
jgi:spermidine/putrescine transport system substrate-binding protein